MEKITNFKFSDTAMDMGFTTEEECEDCASLDNDQLTCIISDVIINAGYTVNWKNEDLSPEEYCELYDIDINNFLKQYKTFLINTL